MYGQQFKTNTGFSAGLFPGVVSGLKLNQVALGTIQPVEKKIGQSLHKESWAALFHTLGMQMAHRNFRGKNINYIKK